MLCGQSLSETIGTAIEQRNNLTVFTINLSDENIDVFNELLSRPGIKAAFTKHLTETQLKDITDFTKVRRHRLNQASIYYSTAVFDQTLSFTADQRKKIMPLRLNTKDDESWVTELTETQKKILNWIKEENVVAAIKSEIRTTQNEIVFDRVDAKTAAMQLDELKKKADMLESHEQTKQIVKAIFAAHTEQLPVYNKHASQLLTLAINGVAQKHLEVEEIMTTYRETEAKLIAAARSEDITSHQAYEELQNLSEKLWHEKNPNSLKIDTIDDTGILGFRFFAHFTKLALGRRSLLMGRRSLLRRKKKIQFGN